MVVWKKVVVFFPDLELGVVYSRWMERLIPSVLMVLGEGCTAITPMMLSLAHHSYHP